jgi:hypothetical protein
MTFILDPKKFSELDVTPTVDGTEIVPIVKDGENAAATIDVMGASKVNRDELATVATTGEYDDLLNKPVIPEVPVTSVAGKTGDVLLDKSDVGLGNVDNTADLDKPISTATQDALDTKEDAANKGIADGYASLDGGGKVPVTQLPSSIFIYKGTWNATTNTPTLADNTGVSGWLYRVNVAGTQNLGSGNITFDVGDYVIHNGTVWEKSDTTDAVASVFGRTGVISAQSGDYTASQVTNVPSGGIGATDVQTALNELDSEKTAGAASSTLNAVPRFSDTTGKVLKNSGVIISDTDSLTVPTSIVITTTSSGIASGDTAGILRLSGGTFNNGGAIILGGSTNGSIPSTGQLRVGTTPTASWNGSAFFPSTSLAFTNGGSSNYWTNSFTQKLTLNSTAIFDGTVAGTANLSSGLLGIGATSNTATHSLTLGSTATGFVAYNTSDQTTNYERVRQFWSGNVFSIQSELGGTGQARSLRIGTANRSTIIQFNDLASTSGFISTAVGTSTAGAVGTVFAGTWNAASGVNPIQQISPTISQSGSAGYTALLVNPTESTTGSGAKLLADLRVGGVSKFSVSNTGRTVTAADIVVATNIRAVSGGIVNDATSANSAVNLTASGTTITRNIADANPALTATQTNASSTGDILQLKNSGGTVASFKQNGVFFPVQAPTASAPTYVIGGMYFDTTLNKLRIGGAAGWETVTSV